MLPLRVVERSRILLERLKALARIGQSAAAQILPAADRVISVEADVPLVRRWRDRHAIAALRAHRMISTGPYSPEMCSSAALYCSGSDMMRAVAFQPAITSCAMAVLPSSVASDNAAMSS